MFRIQLNALELRVAEFHLLLESTQCGCVWFCQVQREVIALVPNLISCLEEVDGDGSYASVRSGSPGAGN